MLQRYLLLWLTLLCLAAYLWPQWSLDAGVVPLWDPFAATKWALKPMFAVAMFAIGSLLPRDEIREVFRRWPTVFGGTLVQYTVMPTAAYALGRAFQLEGDLLTGVIMVGCVPGAMASNVLTLAARGNVSYSVSLTTLSTLISPLVVPAALYLTVRQTGIDNAALAKNATIELLTTVVGPVIAGHWLARQSLRFARAMRTIGPVAANLTILWIIAVIVNTHHDKIGQTGRALAGILLLLNAVGYAAGFGAASVLRLPEGMRRALTLEIGLQNAGLGSILATRLFENNAAVALPPVLYMFGCMLTGTMLAQLWSYRPPAGEQEESAAA